jgi:hypothetical protein
MFSPYDNMLAFGSCLSGFGLLVTGLLALLFRNPDARDGPDRRSSRCWSAYR